MKEMFEGFLIVVATIVVAEVVNEIVGYKLIDVKVDKNTIKRTK